MKFEADLDQLKFDIEPRKIRAISDLYVKYTKFGFSVALDVMEIKTKRNYFIYVTAASLSKPINLIREENGGSIFGCEFWIWKKENNLKSWPDPMRRSIGYVSLGLR